MNTSSRHRNARAIATALIALTLALASGCAGSQPAATEPPATEAMTEVAPGVQIAQKQRVRQAELYACGGLGNLAGNEPGTAACALMVEQNGGAGEQTVAAAIDADHLMGVELCRAIRAAGAKRGGFRLRAFQRFSK